MLGPNKDKNMAGKNRISIYLMTVAITSLVYQQGNCQIVGSEPCPSVGGVTLDDPSHLTGLWYENRKYSADSDNVTSCTRFTFTDPDPQTKRRLMTIDARRKPDGNVLEVFGTMTPIDHRYTRYRVDFPGTNLLSTTYHILGYSPKKWVLVWACSTYDYFHVQQAHLLTYDQVPSEETIENALLAAKANDIPRWLFRLTNQFFCPEEEHFVV